MGKKEEQEMHRDERIEQTGQLTLTNNKEETSGQNQGGIGPFSQESDHPRR